MSSSNSGSSRVEDGTSRDFVLVGAREDSALNFLAGGLEGGTVEVDGISCERDGARVVVMDGCEDEWLFCGDEGRDTGARTITSPPGCSSPMSKREMSVLHTTYLRTLHSHFRFGAPISCETLIKKRNTDERDQHTCFFALFAACIRGLESSTVFRFAGGLGSVGVIGFSSPPCTSMNFRVTGVYSFAVTVGHNDQRRRERTEVGV